MVSKYPLTKDTPQDLVCIIDSMTHRSVEFHFSWPDAARGAERARSQPKKTFADDSFVFPDSLPTHL